MSNKNAASKKRLPIVEKPILGDSTQYPFMFPKTLKREARIICAHREIDLAVYVREAITVHNRKYKNLLFIS